MFRTIKWYLRFVLSLALHNGELKKADKMLALGKNQEYEDFVYSMVTGWAKDRMSDCGAKVNVYGIENLPKENGMLFVCNHQSNFDILLLLSYIPVPKGFIAKIELGRFPWVNQWMKRIHCLFMDRDDIKQSAQTIVEGIKQLKNGINMVIFPEGKRSKTGRIGEFKAGSFKLATKAKKPIVPVTIDGTMNIMEGNHYIIKPGTVNLYIHPPIETALMTKEEAAELPKRVKGIIEADMPYMKNTK